jgi:hypothetical protein
MINGKCKLAPLHAMQVYRNSKGIAPLILDLGIRGQGDRIQSTALNKTGRFK